MVEDTAAMAEESAKVDGIVGSGQVQWLSTTGGPYHEEEESISVLLDPAEATSDFQLEEVHFGTRLNSSIMAGRSDKCDVTLPFKVASKQHCQILLRQFKFEDSQKVHEAIFLRDLSRNGTMVNNQRANQPIQWLQDGDIIGIQAESTTNQTIVHACWKVVYCKHHRFRVKDAKLALAPPPVGGVGEAKPNHAAPAKVSPAAKQQVIKAKAKGKTARGAAAGPPPLPKLETLGQEVVGRVVEIAYIDPPETYRVKIMKYDSESQFHTVDSTGYSTWDDESFQDTLDLNVFQQAGRLTFMETQPQEAQPKKKARTK
mmetsp:Transcript_54907/g.128388  ORF Transcript_54907/g.128388 Transcript_54907/m.128388 type:complete len:315 (+) Transcript_54907:126-1070(+)